MAKKTKRSSARRRPGSPAARSGGAPAASATSTRPAAPPVEVRPSQSPTGIDEEDETAAAAMRAEPEAAPAAELEVATARDASPPATAAAPPPLRRVGRVDPAARRRPAPVVVAPAAELEADDPSVPLARVPYATGDLRRVLVIGSIMVVLIVVATVLVAVLVK